MIEDLVSRLFATRDAVHLEHWRTQSYAAHMALGELYDGLVDKIDSVVEMYQGATGDIVGDVKRRPLPGDLIKHLRDEAEWIEAHLEELSADVKAVENALQDLAGVYFTAIYKLTRFK